MELSATVFLVFRDASAAEGRVPHSWARVEVGNTGALDRCYAPPVAIIPLRGDHECFQQDLSTSFDTDRRLLGYIDHMPQLRVLPGAIVVHCVAGQEVSFAKIHRFESPFARVPYGGTEIPRFHMLPRVLARQIARHYVCTCSVPSGELAGCHLSWAKWRGFAKIRPECLLDVAPG